MDVVSHLTDTSEFRNGSVSRLQLGNCLRSSIEVRPTALLRCHAHTRWTLTLTTHKQT